jgi:hypothetical protein
VKEHSKFTTEQLKRLFDSRKADYEVKIIVQLNLSERDVQFINGRIVEAAKRFGMCLQEDGITYSKKAPYKRFEDITAGFKFYNTLRKYEEYFSVFEYYSYLEGDYNGVICRGFDSNQLHVL